MRFSEAFTRRIYRGRVLADLLQSFRPLVSLAAGGVLTGVIWSLDRHFAAMRRPDPQGWMDVTPGFASWLCMLLCAAIILVMALVLDQGLLGVGERPSGARAAWGLLLLFAAGFALTAVHIVVGLRACISWRSAQIRFRDAAGAIQHRRIDEVAASWSSWSGYAHIVFGDGTRIRFSPYDSGAGGLMVSLLSAD